MKPAPMKSDHTARIGGRKAPATPISVHTISPAVAWRGRGGGRIRLVVHRASGAAAGESQAWIILLLASDDQSCRDGKPCLVRAGCERSLDPRLEIPADVRLRPHHQIAYGR